MASVLIVTLRSSEFDPFFFYLSFALYSAMFTPRDSFFVRRRDLLLLFWALSQRFLNRSNQTGFNDI